IKSRSVRLCYTGFSDASRIIGFYGTGGWPSTTRLSGRLERWIGGLTIALAGGASGAGGKIIGGAHRTLLRHWRRLCFLLRMSHLPKLTV
ncbi:MAG: hypothetical protein DMD30_15875, partial [Gemmatimonadetes bacterium]